MSSWTIPCLHSEFPYDDYIYVVFSFVANIANTVIRKYACNHDELLTDRVSHVADDIETFVSAALKSPAATLYVII